MIKEIFHAVELFAFVLPAIPDSITTRLYIVAAYYAASYFKLQYAYTRFKDTCIKQELELDELAQERFLIHDIDKIA